MQNLGETSADKYKTRTHKRQQQWNLFPRETSFRGDDCRDSVYRQQRLSEHKAKLQELLCPLSRPSAGYFIFSHIHSSKYIPQQRLWALIGKSFFHYDIREKIQVGGKLPNVPKNCKGAGPLIKKSILQALWCYNIKEFVAQNANAVLKQSAVPFLTNNRYS